MKSTNIDYSEDFLVEQPAISLFRELGWQAMGCFKEICGLQGTLGRETRADVVLISKLRPGLEKLNPDIPPEAISLAIEEG